MPTDPNAPVVTKDTEATTGTPGTAPLGTAGRASTSDTEGAPGGYRANVASPAVTQVDTEGAQGAAGLTDAQRAARGSVTVLNTLNPGTGGIPEANPAYRAPSGPPAASTKDTTLTDKQPGGSVTPPSDTSKNATYMDPYSIGAAGTGTGSVAPNAPSGVTAVTASRGILVSWTAPADPSGDKVLGYHIEASDGGVTFAPRGATSMVITNVADDRTVTVRVAARNKKGVGVFSAATAAVRPFNPDAPDVNAPAAGLTAANRVNPIYSPAGVIKPGTGGTNGVTGTPVAVAGAGGSKTITVTVTAPTVGATPTSYEFLASSGEVFTSATASKACVFGASGGAAKTFKVTPINAIGRGEQSAASNAVVSP